MPLLPVIARLDGRAFHSFCRGLERPYDERLSKLMIDCTKYLVQETNANCGYTQSDEITLGWLAADFECQIFFDGRLSKMLSVLAAMQSVYFNKMLPKYLPEEYSTKMPTFDCRVWCVPNVVEGANAFLWREHDATKNSISMAARAYFSHKQVENKKGSEMQEMLWSKKGINWNDYPAFFKRGTFVQRKRTMKPFSIEELDRLPPKHKARKENTSFERNEYVELEMPPFKKVINRPEVIFYGEEPKLQASK